MFFRLLAGQHVQSDKSKPLFDPDGKPTGRFEQQTFLAPAKVASDVNLVAKFGADKFRLIDKKGQQVETAEDDSDTPDNEPSPVHNPGKGTRNLSESYGDLSKLSLKELREIANGEEIDLANATSKSDVLAILQAA